MFRYTFMQHALFASLLIAVVSPCIGMFLVLRRQALIGDTLSHASLAGVTLGLVSGLNPVVSAFIFTALSGALIEYLRRSFRRYAELILSIVLAIGIGTAITIISLGKLHTNAEQFLFGSILTVSRTDLFIIALLSVLSIGVVIALYHPLLYITYDTDAAALAHVKVSLINYLFAILVASIVAMMIRIVGVMVVSTMLALPVATAMQLNQGFRKTLLWAIAFSVLEIGVGLVMSYHLSVAPGGFTALLSVATLLIVIVGRRTLDRVRVRRQHTLETQETP